MTSRTPGQWSAHASVVLVLVAALVVLPGAQNPFNLSKAVVLSVACVLASVAVARTCLPREVLVLGLAGIAWLFFASVASAHPVASLVGRWPRYEGIPMLLLYGALAVSGARVLGVGAPARETALRAGSAVSGVLAVATLLDQVGVSPLGHTLEGRTGSLLGNATDQGLVATMMLLLLAPAALSKRKWWLVAGCGCAALVTVLSGSRTSWGLAVLMLAAMGVVVGRAAGRSTTRPRDPRLLVSGAIATLVLIAVALPQMRSRLLTAETLKTRLVGWTDSVHLALDHLVLGVGPSGYLDAIGRYQDHDWVRVTLAGRRRVDSPHSWVLQALDAGGVVLAALALALAVVVAVRGWWAVRGSHDAVTLGLYLAVVSYGVGLLLNFTSPGPTGIAAFLAGAVVSSPAQRARHHLTGWFLRVVASVLVCVFAVAAVSDITLARSIGAARKGQVARADGLAGDVARWRPGDADAHLLVAQALAQATSDGADAAPQAERQARAGLELAPQSYEGRVSLGAVLLLTDRLKPAARVLDAAVRSNPELAAAYIQRGLARFGLRDVPSALSDLRRAHRLDRRDPTPVRIRREILRRLNADH